jgi:Amt family ammonium transporter
MKNSMSYKKILYAVFAVIVANFAFFSMETLPAFAQEAAPNPIDLGDTAWMLVATSLVLLMTPGLAFFYGGLVRSRNVLNTMMMSLVAMGLILSLIHI